MTKLFSFVTLFVFASGTLSASIDGTVLNGTTGKPQPGVDLTLVKPGQQGMKTIGTAQSDTSGHFLFPNDQPGNGPQLLQATYHGVNYNKLMTPNLPTSDVKILVYEVTKSPAVAHIAQRMMLIEPSMSQIAVGETVVVQNDTTTTYNNTDLGGLRFYLPPAANGQVRVSAQGSQGMPLPRPAERTSENDIFKVDFPIKPGETEFQVNYVLPVGSPFNFQGRVVSVKGMPAGPLRLVVPSGVTLAGKDLQQIGTEPKTQATIYNVLPPGNFSALVSGTGSLHNNGDADAGQDNDEPPIVQGKPQIYTHLGWLAALAFSILAVGLAALFRTSPIGSPSGK